MSKMRSEIAGGAGTRNTRAEIAGARLSAVHDADWRIAVP
jgi:hypothetical protein